MSDPGHDHHAHHAPDENTTQVGALLARSVRLAAHKREHAAHLASHALDLALHLNDTALAAHCALHLATLEWRLSRYEHAAKHASDALARFRHLGNVEQEAWALRLLGNIHGVQSQYVPATEYLRAAAVLSRESNNRECLASCLNNLGIIANELGDYATALEHLFEALRTYPPNDQHVPSTLNNIASQYRQLGQYSRALQFHQQSLDLARSTPVHPLIATILHNMAETLHQHGQGEQALPLLHEALTRARQTNDRQTEMLTLDRLGLIHRDLEDQDVARDYFEQGLSIASTVNHPLAEVRLRMHHARAHPAHLAIDMLRQAMAMAVQSGLKAEELEVHDLLVHAHRQCGNIPAAFDHLERARTLERELFSEAQDRRVQALQIQYDLNKAREMAEAQRVLNEQLQRANEELDAFSYRVSHDLRAPVRHIRSFAGVLRRSLPGEAQSVAGRSLDAIEQAAARMNTLIDALLKLSRESRAPLNHTDVKLNQLVEETRAELLRDEPERQVNWRVENLPQVRGDAALLRQVLLNLLSNALKYTRTRPHAHIHVWAEERDAEWIVHVRDNGVGFDPHSAGKLFAAFERLHRDHEFEGLGIGLATVERIVTRHGGRVFAASRPGEGATFSFTLPTAPP